MDWVSLVAQRLKHLPGMRETWVRSLGREDPLEKEMATHSSTLAWRIPWRKEPSRPQSMGSHDNINNWLKKTNGELEKNLIIEEFNEELRELEYYLSSCCEQSSLMYAKTSKTIKRNRMLANLQSISPKVNNYSDFYHVSTNLLLFFPPDHEV